MIETETMFRSLNQQNQNSQNQNQAPGVSLCV